MKGGWVYILASRYRGTLYIGVTADLPRRMWEHRNGFGSEFVQAYGIHRLVYVEQHTSMHDAITREKQIKAGSRAKKFALIEALNPDWKDLYETLI